MFPRPRHSGVLIPNILSSGGNAGSTPPVRRCPPVHAAVASLVPPVVGRHEWCARHYCDPAGRLSGFATPDIRTRDSTAAGRHKSGNDSHRVPRTAEETSAFGSLVFDPV